MLLPCGQFYRAVKPRPLQAWLVKIKMAASSKETDENPFSFKTFITKAEHGKDEEKKSPKTRIAKKTKKTSSTKNVDDVLFPEVAEGTYIFDQLNISI